MTLNNELKEKLLWAWQLDHITRRLSHVTRDTWHVTVGWAAWSRPAPTWPRLSGPSPRRAARGGSSGSPGQAARRGSSVSRCPQSRETPWRKPWTKRVINIKISNYLNLFCEFLSCLLVTWRDTACHLVGRRGGGWLTMYSSSSKMAMGLWPVAGVRGVRGVRGLGTGCTMFAGSSENAGPKI